MEDLEIDSMHEVLEPTQDPDWILSHEGYNVLSESALESRLAFGNGFLGMRAARSVSRGPTWVALQQMGILAALQCSGTVRRAQHRATSACIGAGQVSL
jgi:hypothetical protein